MWPLPRITDESISCVFTPQALSLSYLVPHKDRVLLKAYRRIVFSHAQLEQSIICNPTQVKKTIKDFITQHNRHAGINIVLSGPSIHEKITAKKATIDNAQHTLYLYTHDDRPFYYVAAINPALLLQYQLIAIALQASLIAITTPFAALLRLYQTVWGATFRHTQLAHDLRMRNHRIETYFSNETIRRMITLSEDITFDLVKERSFLLSSLGIFYLRR